MKKRLISILLVLIMIVSIMQTSVSVDAANSGGAKTGEYGSFIDGEHVISDMIAKNGQQA